MTKPEIIEACRAEITSRIENTQNAINMAKESANSEQKSTAGDKHDTARSMAQFEQEKLSKQLGEHFKLREILGRINAEREYEKVQIGSLIECSNGTFFLGVGLGKMVINEEDIFCISAGSPIGKELLGKKSGEEFIIQQRKHHISHVS